MNDQVMGEDLSLQNYVDEAEKDYEQIQNELKEIDVLIKQSAAEVERLAQKNTQVNSYLRQLQTNFDTVPREDIKEGYEALIQAQQRLFTMRGQLEKLQSDQRNLERLADHLQRIVNLTDGLGSMPSGRKSRGGGGSGQSNIVRIIQIEESARQSLVRKMHDGPASSLSNFILQAEICQRFFDNNPERARAELNALKGSAASTFGAVKDFIFDLRPMMLDDLGVVPTLRRYVESFQEKSSTSVSITITGIERRLEEHIEVTIFRAVQELLNNAWTHGQSTQMQVLLDLDEHKILAVVEDNGSGFNVDDVLSNLSKGTIGLATLRERIDMLNGDFNIQSSLGQGTRVEFSIPIEEEEVMIT